MDLATEPKMGAFAVVAGLRCRPVPTYLVTHKVIQSC